MKFLYIPALLMLTILSGCGDVFNLTATSDSLNNDSAQQKISLIESLIDGDRSEGQFDPNSPDTQRLNGGGLLAGSALLIPPGALPGNLTVVIAPAPALNESAELSTLTSADNEVLNQGQAVAFMPSNRNATLLAPMTLQLPPLATRTPDSHLAVVYRAVVPDEGGSEFGLVPSSQLTVSDDSVQMETQKFGSFQLIETSTEITEEKSVASETPVAEPEFISEAAQQEQTATAVEVEQNSGEEQTEEEEEETPPAPPPPPPPPPSPELHNATEIGLAVPPSGTSGTTLYTFDVEQDIELVNLTVSINLTHTHQGDLRISLISPNETTVVLWNRTGGGTDDVIQTWTASEIPDLSNFSTVSSQGTWTLKIEDLLSGDVGSLNSFSFVVGD